MSSKRAHRRKRQTRRKRRHEQKQRKAAMQKLANHVAGKLQIPSHLYDQMAYYVATLGHSVYQIKPKSASFEESKMIRYELKKPDGTTIMRWVVRPGYKAEWDKDSITEPYGLFVENVFREAYNGYEFKPPEEPKGPTLMDVLANPYSEADVAAQASAYMGLTGLMKDMKDCKHENTSLESTEEGKDAAVICGHCGIRWYLTDADINWAMEVHDQTKEPLHKILGNEARERWAVSMMS